MLNSRLDTQAHAFLYLLHQKASSCYHKGSPVACAAALSYISIIEREKLVGKSQVLGIITKDEIDEMVSKLDRIIAKDSQERQRAVE